MKHQDAGRMIGIINNKIKRYFEFSNSTKDLTGMQGQILHFLLARGGELYPKDIEEEFGIRRATVSRYLVALEKTGIVTRQSVDGDGRLRQIMLTEKACELNEVIKADIKALESKLTYGFSEEEKNEFVRLAEKMEKNMES